MSVTVQCPTCGAPVEFRYDTSFVRICDSCQNALVRGDRTIDSLGRVADLADSGSPLDLGLDGLWRDERFSLAGRAQLGHAAGGIWDEWYAGFGDGRWGWLAESQGRFHLTFEVEDAGALPAFAALRAGETVSFAAAPGVSFVVVDLGDATYRTARGEIPFRLVPGECVRFADLSGPSGAFATIDYGDPLAPDSAAAPALYLGREVTLDDLGIVRGSGRAADEGPRDRVEVRGARLACPQCNGSVDLRSPDSLRMVCPYCGSLLDIDHGQLAFLGKPSKSKPVPTLPLGSTARFEGEAFTVIGFVEREAILGGVAYPFEEHLLYHPRLGYRWLVLSDGHWSYVTEIAAGDVETEYSRVRYGGQWYPCFQRAGLRVSRVLGELTWKVEPGETVEGIDYIAPPQMLSLERSGGEIHWSRGTWLSADEVERATGVEKLPRPSGVAPNQPFPQRALLKLWLPALAAWAAVTFAYCASAAERPAAAARVDLDALAAAGPPPAERAAPGEAPPVQPPPEAGASLVYFSEPFSLDGGENNAVTVSAPALSNGWVMISGDLIASDSGMVESFEQPLEEWHGFEDGESWHEGTDRATIYLSAVPAGQYALRLEVERPPGGVSSIDVEIRQDVFRWSHALVAFALISLLPAIVAVWWFLFERRRWRDSDHAPGWARAGESE